MKTNEEILHDLFGIRHDCEPTTPMDVKECKLAMNEIRKGAFEFVPIEKIDLGKLEDNTKYILRLVSDDWCSCHFGRIVKKIHEDVSHILLPL